MFMKQSDFKDAGGKKQQIFTHLRDTEMKFLFFPTKRTHISIFFFSITEHNLSFLTHTKCTNSTLWCPKAS